MESDILRSTVAIGREFYLLFHNSPRTMLNQLLIIWDLPILIVLSNFSILKLLIEYRRTVHAECVNNNKNVVELVVGDIVMARTTI